MMIVAAARTALLETKDTSVQLSSLVLNMKQINMVVVKAVQEAQVTKEKRSSKAGHHIEVLADKYIELHAECNSQERKKIVRALEATLEKWLAVKRLISSELEVLREAGESMRATVKQYKTLQTKILLGAAAVGIMVVGVGAAVDTQILELEDLMERVKNNIRLCEDTCEDTTKSHNIAKTFTIIFSQSDTKEGFVQQLDELDEEARQELHAKSKEQIKVLDVLDTTTASWAEQAKHTWRLLGAMKVFQHSDPIKMGRATE